MKEQYRILSNHEPQKNTIFFQFKIRMLEIGR